MSLGGNLFQGVLSYRASSLFRIQRLNYNHIELMRISPHESCFKEAAVKGSSIYWITIDVVLIEYLYR